MKPTKRQGFTWDQEYKDFVDTLKSELKGFSSSGETPSSTEIFMLCLAIGFASGVKRDVPVRKTDGPRLSFIQPEQMALIKAVGLAEAEEADALIDEDSIYDIAEQYASGGLMLLSDAYKTNPNYRDWLRSKLVDYSKIKAA
jgi:hypothetical protein